MREYSKILPRFWKGELGRKLREAGRDVQVLVLYLNSSPAANMYGLYYLPIPTICHETGLSRQGASKALRRAFEGAYCRYSYDREEVWVPDMASDQIGEYLEVNDKRVIGIRKDIQALRKSPFYPEFYERYSAAFHFEDISPFEGACKPLRSQEQEQEQNKDSMSDSKNAPFRLVSQRPDKPDQLQVDATGLLTFLNEKSGRNYRQVHANLKQIIARLNSDTPRPTVAECRQIIARKCQEWRGSDKMARYIRPKTLFDATNFEQYLAEVRTDQVATDNQKPVQGMR